MHVWYVWCEITYIGGSRIIEITMPECLRGGQDLVQEPSHQTPENLRVYLDWRMSARWILNITLPDSGILQVCNSLTWDG